VIVITAVIVLSSISAFLGVLLILADKFLADFGECSLTINSEKVLRIRGGQSILSYLTAEKIFVPSGCGGKATCGFCKGRVITDVGPILPTEKPFITTGELKNNTRLLCQIKVKKDIDIIIPEEFFLVKEYLTILESIIPLTYDTKLFRFKLNTPQEITFKPGQFVQFRIPKTGEERAYSVASGSHENGYIELIVRLVPGGLCTTYMFNKLKVGQSYFITGPYGDFYLHEDTDDPIICVGGGSGSAPLRSIIHSLKEKKSTRKIILFYGARTPKDMYFVEEYRALEKEMSDFIYYPAVSEPLCKGEQWECETGLITTVIDRCLKDIPHYEAYMCGPPIMIDVAREVLLRHGIKEERIYYDKF
jgi:Na+-transporting NADH:ubiquinone oxidoreductase subunit F